MAVQIANKGAVASGTTTALAVSAPAGSGGVLVLFVTAVDLQAFATPTGWTARAAAIQPNFCTMAIFDRVSDGTAADSPTVSLIDNHSDSIAGVIYRLSGAHETDYYDAGAEETGTDAQDASWDVPAFTVANDGSLQLVCLNTISNSLPTWPSPLVEETEFVAGSDLHVASAPRDAGSVSAQTVTQTTVTIKAFATVCYAPAGGGAVATPYPYGICI